MKTTNTLGTSWAGNGGDYREDSGIKGRGGLRQLMAERTLEITCPASMQEAAELIRKLQVNPEVLRQAIRDGLLALGSPIKDTILWHMEAHGIFLNSEDEIDSTIFYLHLHRLVGQGADLIMIDICDNLKRNCTNAALLQVALAN